MAHIILVRGHAIRQNIHCSDPEDLAPILEIHNIHAVQLAFGVRLSGSCMIHYDPGKNPDVWIETPHPIDITERPILPLENPLWCISTHSGHHRSNRKRIREHLSLPLLPVIAVRKGRSGKAIHTNHIHVPQKSDVIYADPTRNCSKLRCGAFVWLHTSEEPIHEFNQHLNRQRKLI